jgi:phospholipid-translocating ATPase
MVRDVITAMTVCNNVTPIYDINGGVTYEASSPDEIALVKIAEKTKMRLLERTDKYVSIKNSADIIEEYEILANFPFTSENKRMGILLRNKKHGHIIFYLKGAENVITKFVRMEYISFIKENSEYLASIGLRTLILTQKIVSNDFYNEWIKEYNDALTSMGDRKTQIQNVISQLESNMEFLGVSGVEGIIH